MPHQQRVLADLAQVCEDVVNALAAQLADHERCIILALRLDGGSGGAAPVVQRPKATRVTALAGGPWGGAACVCGVLRISVGACQLTAAPAVGTDGCWPCRGQA